MTTIEPVLFRGTGDWPSLLLGPIVRKVTSTDAWVFIATKEPFEAKLLVGAGTLTPSDIPDSADVGVQLRSIGTHLYVGLLHATLPNPAANTVYSYDIQLTRPPGPPNTPAIPPLRLDTLGLLGNPAPNSQDQDPIQFDVPLGYLRGRLPTFVTPPSDPTELRIAQCSCRKPHGNTTDPLEADALPILDEIIERTQGLRPQEPADSQTTWLDAVGLPTTAPAYPPADLVATTDRPHQLIMTGDQIYADDVAPSLLDAASHIGDQLMEWDEYLPGIVDGLNGFLVEPGWRTRYLSMCGLKDEVPIGKTDYPQSHLLRFGEWCAMYLLAWSPALWPRTNDGTSVRLRESTERLPVSEVAGVVSIYQKLPYTRLRQLSMPMSYLLDKTLNSFKASGKFEKNRIATWDKTRDAAMKFGSTVPYVRRVMANTPTYMMFDDHEVTDDWYVNADTADRLLGKDAPQSDWWAKEIGPRILRNALSSYAIFQHWGNEPLDFHGWDGSPPRVENNVTLPPSVGLQLLDLWQPPAGYQRPQIGGPEEDHSALEHFVGDDAWWVGDPAESEDQVGDPPPGVDTTWLHWTGSIHPDAHLADDLLRISERPTDNNGNFIGSGVPSDRFNFGRFRWDYAIEFDSHRLIALDTRTWRRFPTSSAPLPLVGSLVGADVVAARDVTAPVLADYALDWLGVTDPATELLRVVLTTVSDVLNGSAMTTIATSMLDLANALEDYMRILENDGDVFPWAQSSIQTFRDHVNGTEAYTTRFDIDTMERSWTRSAALIRELVDGLEWYESEYYSEISWPIWSLVIYMEAVVGGGSQDALVSLDKAVAEIVDSITYGGSNFAPWPNDVTLIEAARDTAMAALDTAITAHQVHERSNAFFRDGTSYLAAELISEPAMQWMVTDPLNDVGPGKETVILSPAPMFADDVVDLVQRALMLHSTASGGPGAEDWEFEAWGANPLGFDHLVTAAKALERAVVLSGDVHYGYSSWNHVRLPIERADTVYVQLVSSSAKNSDGVTKRIGFAADALWDGQGMFKLHPMNISKVLSWDVFNEPANTPTSPAPQGAGVAERFIGWLGEYFESVLETTAQEYHLDDLSLMMTEWWECDDPLELVKWKMRWFYNPALASMWHVVTNPQDYVVPAWDFITQAPVTSFTGWIHNTLWLNIDRLHNFQKLLEDPKKAFFGHYLYSRDVFAEQVANAYKALGVDPSYGVTITKYNVRDHRKTRLMEYGGRVRFDGDKDPYSMMYGNEQEIQVVGSANVGLVRYERDAHGGLAVRQDLLFYPDPTDPDVVPDHPGPYVPGQPPPFDAGKIKTPYPRKDWMATTHSVSFVRQPAPQVAP